MGLLCSDPITPPPVTPSNPPSRPVPPLPVSSSLPPLSSPNPLVHLAPSIHPSLLRPAQSVAGTAPPLSPPSQLACRNSPLRWGQVQDYLSENTGHPQAVPQPQGRPLTVEPHWTPVRVRRALRPKAGTWPDCPVKTAFIHKNLTAIRSPSLLPVYETHISAVAFCFVFM